MNLLNEVLDEDKLDLPVTNLYPKTKIPQIFSIGEPGTGDLPAFRICSYTSGGDTNKNVKPGDKMIHVVMLSLNSKGSLVKLKGLGDDPIGVISTTFNIVYDSMKKYKMDACLFRMQKTKVGGQARQLQVIMDRLVRTRTGGKFVILKELWDYDKKYSYILIYRKNTDLQTVPGVPDIDTKLFTKVDSKVGDVYVSKEDGKQVTKAVAIAKSIAVENDARSDQNVISRAKISRRQAISAQYSVNADTIEGDEKTSFEFRRLESKVPVRSTKGQSSSMGQFSLNSRLEKKSFQVLQTSMDSTTSPKDARGRERSSGEMLRDQLGLIKAKKGSKNFDVEAPAVGSTLDIGYDTYMDNQGELYDTTRKAARIISNMNTKNSFQSMKDLVKLATDGLPADADLRARVIQPFMNSAYSIINKMYAESYDGSVNAENLQYTQEEQEAISEYCANMYEYMNLFLIGKPDPDYSTKEVVDMIDTLDGAFEKGSKLEPGTILYRGQDIDFKAFEHSVENKLFYFRNYVSTSFKPLIFGEFGRMIDHLDDDTTVYSGGEGGRQWVDPEDLIDYGTSKTRPDDQVKIGFVITDADVIKVIIPQSLSNYPEEAEVILPRGTLLKISKVTTPVNKRAKQSKFMIEAKVVPASEQMDEAALYDGDLFLETGEVKVLSGFEKFIAESVYDEEANDAASGILAEFIDINDLPKKFR